jgi:hypothetical protein
MITATITILDSYQLERHTGTFCDRTIITKILLKMEIITHNLTYLK